MADPRTIGKWVGWGEEFYVECHLEESSGPTKLADLACERTAEAVQALAKNLSQMYRPGDADRIRLRLRGANRADIVDVAVALKDVADSPVRQAWAVAGAEAVSGGQVREFNEEDRAPASWVSGVEGATVGTAVWQDASWGNNAAPSWELLDGDAVLAEAFYYTTENGERLSKNFPVGPYVSVLMYDEDDNPAVSFETSSDDFLGIVRLADSGAVDPAKALMLTAEQVPQGVRIYWDRDI
jgi:hypothetical protein